MKIKNIGYLSFLILLTICSSCEKLDRELDTDLSKKQLTGSFSSMQSLLTGVYITLPEGLTPIGGQAMMASAIDEAEHTLETNPVQIINQGAWTPTNNPIDIWGAAYTGIRKANFFLENLDVDKINLDNFVGTANYQIRLDEINRWPYEVRFLRAFHYFELLKKYGGVPLVTKTLSEEDIVGLKRNTLAECIKFVSDECDTAAAKLPINYAVTLANDQGRATKGAALALKSKLLLYAASDLFNKPIWAGGYSNPEYISLPAGDRAVRWKAAADAAKAVIDLTPAYTRFTNYRTLFTTPYTSSIIFARRLPASLNFELFNFPIGFDRGQSGTTPSENLVQDYEIRVGGIWVPFDWNNPAHNANPYTNRDPRLALSVVTNGASFSTVAGQTRAVETFLGGKDAPPIPNATKTGYYLRKFINEAANLPNSTGATIRQWIYFRIEEVYLNYAEALNEYSPNHPDIKTYYDLVRTRTGVGLTGLNAAEGQIQISNRIRHERRVEFAFEDHRAWDVRRWMIAPTVLGAPLRGVRIVNTGASAVYTPFDVENRVFDSKMYLLPIPQRELDIAKGLIQNPLW